MLERHNDTRKFPKLNNKILIKTESSYETKEFQKTLQNFLKFP